LIKEVKLDKNLSNSLIKGSQKKLKTEGMIVLNKDTSTSKISLAYDALRELLEALAISNGYKIYNHECYCSFLKEIMKESTISNRFDSLRKIRNKINYYGKEVDPTETKIILKEIKELMNKINDIVNFDGQRI